MKNEEIVKVKNNEKVVSSLAKWPIALSGNKIFPNPARRTINIATESAPLRVSFYNLYGKLALNVRNKHHINVSTLKSGCYVVLIEDENNNFCYTKVVIK